MMRLFYHAPLRKTGRADKKSAARDGGNGSAGDERKKSPENF